MLSQDALGMQARLTYLWICHYSNQVLLDNSYDTK